MLRSAGRTGTRWVSSAGGLLDGFVSDVAPHPDGGVVLASGSDGRISIAHMDPDGNGRLIARIDGDSLSSQDWLHGERVLARPNGYVVASLERPPGAQTELVVRALDEQG